MSTELELYRPELEAGRRRWVELMRPAAELAAQIAGTDFVPRAMRDNPAAIAACVLYGDEVGLGPMQALTKIAVIDGRPTLAAEAMRSLIFAAGHELWVEDSTVQKATVAGRRAGSQQVTRVTWSLEDAKRAALAGKPNWRSYPRQMLTARATAELARLIFADAIGGLAATEELEEVEAALGRVEPEEAKPKGKARRRSSAPLAAVTEPATGPEEPPSREAPPVPGDPGYEGRVATSRDPLSEGQRRKLFAAFRERDVTDRAERLEWTSAALGRKVESWNDLSNGEASTLIEALEADDIPFGLPTEPEPVGAPESPPEGAEVQNDSPPPEEPQAVQEELSEPQPEPLSVVMFRARFIHEGFSTEDVSAAGHELYEGRSLADLSDEERATLLEHLITKRDSEEAG